LSYLLSIHWILIASIWYFGNGILHDIFVVKNHKGSYDRELLRLLMDGHVLILSGAVLFICYLMLRDPILQSTGMIIGMIIAIGMLVYCAMIYPFLKSFITMAISMIVFAVCLRVYLVEFFAN
jgi:hypothetical protein